MEKFRIICLAKDRPKSLRYRAWGWWGGHAPKERLIPTVIIYDRWYNGRRMIKGKLTLRGEVAQYLLTG